jgi:oxygen-independent coproporphyrinogen-3 oxidase
VRKCPYCDFNSHPLRERDDRAAYLTALLADLDLELARVPGRILHSVFVGGGTPSLFSGESIRRLLQAIGERAQCVPDLEVTLEANPGAVEAERFSAYRDAGVNRLSIGVQSFDRRSLELLGRIHGPEEAQRAVELARRAGFANVNLDLMFGLPEQSLEGAGRDLEAALQLTPEHLSYYQLTLEPNTQFHHRPPPLPNDEAIWEMQQQGAARLTSCGFARYEVSAYARPGRQCRHNVNYWSFGDYLGIGAGAHGKLSRLGQGIERRWKVRDPRAYMAAQGGRTALAGRRRLDPQDLVLEFMMNALRLARGFSVAQFETRTGIAFTQIRERVAHLRQIGLLEQQGRRIRASDLGQRFLNDLLEAFLPGEVERAPQEDSESVCPETNPPDSTIS